MGGHFELSSPLITVKISYTVYLTKSKFSKKKKEKRKEKKRKGKKKKKEKKERKERKGINNCGKREREREMFYFFYIQSRLLALVGVRT